MTATITQPEQLAALAVKKAPYTAAKLGAGLTLLVYKQAKGTHWGMYSEHGKKKIGPAQIADGGEGMTFSEASAFAKQLFEQEQATGVAAIVEETCDMDPGTMTFGQAWELYLEWVEATKNEWAVKTIRYQYEGTSDLHPMKITTTPLRVLKAWAEGQLGKVGRTGKVKTSGSVGRNISQMKAALNHVQAEYDVDLSGPWQKLKAPANALAPVKKNPQGALMGDDLEVVVSAAYRIGQEEGYLFHLMALTGLRQSDLTKATVGCFKPASSLLALSEHKTGDLTVIL